MRGEDSPEAHGAAAIDDALSGIFGIHGPWVLAIETYDPETGERRITLSHDEDAAPWTHLGMTHALAADLEVPYRAE